MKLHGSVQNLISTLTLEEKVGQVFMLGFSGKDPGDASPVVCDLKAGGVIYFARNTGDVRETWKLSASLQDMALSATGIPLLVSADQEGGIVSRLTRGLPGMPGAMSLGATDDPLLVEAVSRGIGTQLRAAGVNMDLAPVLDVNDNPRNPVIGVRSFGSDPSRVASLGASAVKGFLTAGIAPVGKHFPGHGNTSVDSHVDLPVLAKPMEKLEQAELVPFREAVRTGLPAIMTAHIVFTAIDPHSPATMSSPVLAGLLRQRMGFGGVIMTDCLEMDAISKKPGTVRAAVLAFQAGADLLLISHTRSLQEQAYEALLEAVRSGQVPLARLDEAVFRMLSLKKTMGIPNSLTPAAANTPELCALSREAHIRSVTAVRMAATAAPGAGATAAPRAGAAAKAGARILVVSPASPRRERTGAASQATSGKPGGILAGASAGTGPTPAAELARRLSALGMPARETTPDEAMTAALSGCGNTIVILTQNAWKDAGQLACAEQLLQAAPDAIVAAIRDPYDASVLPSAKTFLCTYSPRPEAMDALSLVLTGRKLAAGRLPVVLE